MKYVLSIVFIVSALFIVLLSSSHIVSAETISYTFKQHTTVDLKRSCFNNGTWCSPVTICNITILKPDNSLLVNNAIMTNQVSYHNITLTSSMTSIIGVYSSNMVCKDGGLFGAETFYFEINPTGDDRGITLPLTLGLFGLVILVFGWYNKNVWLVYIAGTLFTALGVYVMIYGFADLADIYTRMIAYTMIGLGILFTVAAIYEQVWGGETFEED